MFYHTFYVLESDRKVIKSILMFLSYILCFSYSSGFISDVVIKYPDKRGDYFAYNSKLQSIILGKSKQKLRKLSHIIAPVKSRVQCVLACLLSLAFSHLIQFRTSYLRTSITHNGLDCPTSIGNQDSPTKTHSQTNQNLAIPQLKLSSQILSSWQLKLTMIGTNVLKSLEGER